MSRVADREGFDATCRINDLERQTCVSGDIGAKALSEEVTNRVSPLACWKGAYHSGKTLLCPFCGTLPIIVPWHGDGPRKRMVMCRADECPITPGVTGSTEARAIAKWNTRYDGDYR